MKGLKEKKRTYILKLQIPRCLLETGEEEQRWWERERREGGREEGSGKEREMHKDGFSRA